MQRAIADRLVDDDFAVTYLDIEQAFWIAADPRLEVNRRALAPEIREWHQISLPALSTTWKRHVHAYRSLPQPHPVVQPVTLSHEQERTGKLATASPPHPLPRTTRKIPRCTISHNLNSTACLRRCIAAIPVVGAHSYPFGFQRQAIKDRLYTVHAQLVHRCAHLVSSRVCSKDGRSRLSQRQLSTIGAVVHLYLCTSCDILK